MTFFFSLNYLNLATCFQVDSASYENLCSGSDGAIDQSPCQPLCMVFYDCSIELGVNMLFIIVISSEKNAECCLKIAEHCYFYSNWTLYTSFCWINSIINWKGLKNDLYCEALICFYWVSFLSCPDLKMKYVKIDD